MIKPSITLQELRRRIYRKAKAEKTWRFWGLYVHVCKRETLREAYREARANDGAPGLDGVSFESIEALRQRGRCGFGWKRWSNEAIYEEWGLVDEYRVRYFYRSPVKVLLAQ
jgi:hypothetical protein